LIPTKDFKNQTAKVFKIRFLVGCLTYFHVPDDLVLNEEEILTDNIHR